MTFILGSVIAAALKTQNVVRREMLPSSSFSGLAEAYIDYHNTMSLQQTIGTLQNQNEILEKGVAGRTPETKELTDQLDQYRFLAGITPVTGPGITVTLQDSVKRPPANLPSQIAMDMTLSFIIHDLDIQRVVNELRASGAEAFAVNDQRVVTTTAIRCVGAAIQVNGVPLTPPYIIRAIGDSGTLYGALQLPGGIAEQLKQTDPAMISVQKSSTLLLPAYDGSIMFRYSKPVKNVSGADVSDDQGGSGYGLQGGVQ
jgi:uncharacterized protein YlxW (UPF0749 family)